MSKDRIDVVMLTKNSAKPLLDKCLRSIYANIPVRRLIVVDAYSTDNTAKILEAYPDVKFIQMDGTRGLAREIGIKEVESDWFAFVDSDVILCKDWYRRIIRNIKDDVGAVWGVAIPIAPKDRMRCQAMSRFYRRPLKETMMMEGKRRGMLHDTIIRSELVKDLKIPRHLHVLEDQYIKQKILREGFTWVATTSAYCYHYADITSRNTRELREFGRLSRRYNFYSWRRILLFTLLTLPKAVWLYAFTRDLGIAKWQIEAYRMIVAGWLSK